MIRAQDVCYVGADEEVECGCDVGVDEEADTLHHHASQDIIMSVIMSIVCHLIDHHSSMNMWRQLRQTCSLNLACSSACEARRLSASDSFSSSSESVTAFAQETVGVG